MLEHAFEAAVPADHPCLAGHFPGQPVVPAVMLLEFVAQGLSEALARRVSLSAVPAAKFTRPLLPQQAVRVELQIDTAGRCARFKLSAQGEELAQGRVEYIDD